MGKPMHAFLPEIIDPQPAQRSLMADDDIWDDLLAWHDSGKAVVLVTLVNIDGSTPRALGAEMVVCEDGDYAGYLSGGCLEASVALEAEQVMANSSNRLVRYGKGSPYFDIRLPCGSGLDLYFNSNLSHSLIEQIRALRERRCRFELITHLQSGEVQVREIRDEQSPASQLKDGWFHRVHQPLARLLLIGAGPALSAIAALAELSGLQMLIATPDKNSRAELKQRGIESIEFTGIDSVDPGFVDRWTATVLCFHDHDWEYPILAKLLDTDTFYLGALGSRKAHQQRLAALKAMNIPEQKIARIQGQIGLIGGAKSRLPLAVGILADVLAHAKQHGFVY